MMNERTEGIVRQAQELIEQAYQRGYKAGREEGFKNGFDEGASHPNINIIEEWIEQGRNEAWEAAIQTLQPEPCEDAISRQAVDEYISHLLSDYLYDEERERLEQFCAWLWDELPPVQPTACIAKISFDDQQIEEMVDKAKCEILAARPDITHANNYGVDKVLTEIEKFTRLQREHNEQTLAEIITKYDFMVGSEECKYKLMEVLPEGANVICTPYIDSPTAIFAIKKFDIMDYLVEPQESEDK